MIRIRYVLNDVICVFVIHFSFDIICPGSEIYHDRNLNEQTSDSLIFLREDGAVGAVARRAGADNGVADGVVVAATVDGGYASVYPGHASADA